MRNMIILVMLFWAVCLNCASVRVFFTVEIQTEPSGADVSIKTGPLLDWEYLGTSPHTITCFRDLDVSEFMKVRPMYKGQFAYYSERYGYNSMWASADGLFGQLRRDFGEAILSDLGVCNVGWIKAEYDGFESSVKTLSLNSNIEFMSFDKSKSQQNRNRLYIPMKELDYWYDDDYDYDWYNPTTTVDVSSDPPGCAVYSNEEYVGNTPCSLTFRWWSPDSRIEIRMEKSGYITNRRMVTPREERIHVVLQPMY